MAVVVGYLSSVYCLIIVSLSVDVRPVVASMGCTGVYSDANELIFELVFFWRWATILLLSFLGLSVCSLVGFSLVVFILLLLFVAFFILFILVFSSF